MGISYTPNKYDSSIELYSTKEITLIANCFGGKGIVIDTGVHVKIPEGYVGCVYGRNDLNIERGIICPTLIINSNDTESIKVKLYNLGNNDFVIPNNFKIAQLIVQPLTNFTSIRTYDEVS